MSNKQRMHFPPALAPPAFKVGQTVLVRWSDRKLYFCKVVARPSRLDSRYWIQFDDNTREFATEDMLHDERATFSDVPCSVCNKKRHGNAPADNDLLVCSQCALGYHQKCHQPPVPVFVDDWRCDLCQMQGSEEEEARSSSASHSDSDGAHGPAKEPKPGSPVQRKRKRSPPAAAKRV